LWTALDRRGEVVDRLLVVPYFRVARAAPVARPPVARGDLDSSVEIRQGATIDCFLMTVVILLRSLPEDREGPNVAESQIRAKADASAKGQLGFGVLSGSVESQTQPKVGP